MTASRRRFLAIAFALAAAFACAYRFSMAGLYLESAAQEPVKADLIVALGGDHGSRSEKAAELFRSGFAPVVLLAGMGEGADYRSSPRARFIMDKGVPESALLFDGRSRNSWEEAVNTFGLMKARGMKEVLIVSDPPHLRRLSWAWGKVFARSGMGFHLIAAPMKDWDAGRWWLRERTIRVVAREYVKWLYYVLVHRID